MAEAGDLTPLGRRFDFCLAWNWEHDAAFVGILTRACRERGLTVLEVTPQNVDETVARLAAGDLTFRALFDRASDIDARFLALSEWGSGHGTHQINRHRHAVESRDKASMHLQFITARLNTPHTIILPSYAERPLLGDLDLSVLGERFCVKPAHGGGGEGVIRHARTREDVENARRSFPSDRYLVQAWVAPAQLDGRPAWYRVLYCMGDVFSCWWDPATHRYDRVTEEEEARYNVGGLRGVAHVIAWICGLDLFSTEIARTPDGSLVVVDYVNDPVDLRPRSLTPDGVPDEVVLRIANRLAAHVSSLAQPDRVSGGAASSP